MHPGCTVYNQKEQTEGFSLLVEYAELGMCVYINIYNTDLKIKFPDIHFF